jgi:hypothetical protein
MQMTRSKNETLGQRSTATPSPDTPGRRAVETPKARFFGVRFCGDHGILQTVTMICVRRRSLMATVVSIGPGTILRSPNKHPIRRNGTTVRTKLRLRNRFPNTAMEIFGRCGKMRVG